MEKSSLSNLIFLIFFFHNVVQIESSRRLLKASNGFESHATSIDGLTSVDFQSPSVVKPVLSVVDKIGVLVASSRILAEMPMEYSPASIESPPAGGSPNHVLVIVICSFVLAGILIALTCFICVKSRKRNKRRQSSSKSTSSTPAVPSTLPPNQPVVNGRGDDGPAQGKAIVQGDGGPKPKPSDQPVHPKPSDQIVHPKPADQPVHPKPADQPVHPKPSDQPVHPKPSMNGQGDAGPKPTIVTKQSKSNAGPSRVAEFGLIPFSYEELRVSTDNFSRTNFLGKGGFAEVYKGTLSNDRKVAVKVLRNENSKAEKEFRNEVDIISRARHRNVVSLVGYCITETKRLIVYEFVENKSLYDHLRGGKDIKFMDWTIRMKIARGASKGLAYLHDECPQKIIHRDVKPANILLNSKFVAKVADFGISKLCPEHFDTLITTNLIGSPGYMDPIYFETKEFSFKTDVYSFGVVLLELISGHIDLVEVHGLENQLSKALESRNFDGIADARLNLNYNLNEMVRMVSCAEACLRREPNDRPLMKEIVDKLANPMSPAEMRIRTMPPE